MLDIALGFDARYAIHARVTIESVLAAQQRAADRTVGVRFWLAATPDVGPAQRHAIRQQVAGRAEVTFVAADLAAAELGRSVYDSAAHVSEAMYLRLDLPHLVGEDVTRLVYLDCDVLCTRSIAALSTWDLAGRTVGAVRDAFTRRVSDSGGLPGFVGGGLDPRADYFNSGVLVVDVAAWRSRQVTRRCLAYLREHCDGLRFPDQDALNLALHGDWLRLPREWNYMMVWRLERVMGGNLADAHLIHSAGPVKYWHRQLAGTDLQKLYLHLRRSTDAHPAVV